MDDSGVLREREHGGRSSLDNNYNHASSGAATFSFGSRRREPVATNVLDLSTKYEADEEEEVTVMSELRRELREKEKEIERVSLQICKSDLTESYVSFRSRV